MATYRVMKIAKDGTPLDSRLVEAESKSRAIEIARPDLPIQPSEQASLRAVIVPE